MILPASQMDRDNPKYKPYLAAHERCPCHPKVTACFFAAGMSYLCGLAGGLTIQPKYGERHAMQNTICSHFGLIGSCWQNGNINYYAKYWMVV